MEDVDLDEIELVYDTLAKSERIVRGYTEFGFEDKGVRRAYRTSEPDAVRRIRRQTNRRSTYGNPLFRAEGILFESVGVGSGGRGGGGDVFDSVSRATRVAPASSRVRSPGPRSTDPSRGEDPEACSRPATLLGAAVALAVASLVAAPGLGIGLSAPTDVRRWSNPTGVSDARVGDAAGRRRARRRDETRGRASPDTRGVRVDRKDTDRAQGGARTHGGAGDGDGGGEEASPEANLGPRFNAASGDGDAIRRRRRKKVVDALARPAFDAWRELARGTEAARQAAMLRKAVGAFSRSTTAAALRRWAEFADERKQMRGLLERAAAKFRNATISGAFSRWVERAEEASEMRELLSRW